MNKDEALKLALEALERYQVKRQDFDRFADEITAIKQALAAPVQEPVQAEFWLHQCRKKPELRHLSFNRMEPTLAAKGYETIPLGRFDTTPPAAPVQEPEQLQQGVDALVSAARTALEVLEKHRQMKGEPPMGMLGVRAIGELKEAFRLLYPQDDYEPPAQPAPVLSAGPITPEMANWSEADKAELTAVMASHLATPPAAQRQWVGLTDEEILKLAYPIRWQEVDDFEADKAVNFAQMVEAKLKEKNNG